MSNYIPPQNLRDVGYLEGSDFHSVPETDPVPDLDENGNPRAYNAGYLTGYSTGESAGLATGYSSGVDDGTDIGEGNIFRFTAYPDLFGGVALSDNVWTKVPFTDGCQIVGLNYNSSNSRITAIEACTLSVGGLVRVTRSGGSSSAATDGIVAAIRRNGSAVATGQLTQFRASSSDQGVAAVYGNISLSAGQYIELWVKADMDGTRQLDVPQCSFWGYHIGTDPYQY